MMLTRLDVEILESLQYVRNLGRPFNPGSISLGPGASVKRPRQISTVP